MEPPASASVGCRIVGEFIDQPDSNLPERSGKRVSPGGVGTRIVGEFVDHAPAPQPPVEKSSHLPPNLQTSASGMTLYDRALTHYEQLVRQGGHSDLASDLARAYANKAVAIRELGEHRAAAALADQTIALYERLVQRNGAQTMLTDLATAYLNKAAWVRARGDRPSAATWYDRAIAVYERLVHQEGHHELANQLAATCQERADALAGLEDQ